MKNTGASDLNERERERDRETNWKREIHQLTFDLQGASRGRSGTQHAADDVEDQVSRGRHKDRTGRCACSHWRNAPPV